MRRHRARRQSPVRVLFVGDMPVPSAAELARESGVPFLVAADRGTAGLPGSMVRGAFDVVVAGSESREDILRIIDSTPGEVAVLGVGLSEDGEPDGHLWSSLDQDTLEETPRLAVAIAEAARTARSARREGTKLRWLERGERFDALTGLHSRRDLEEYIGRLDGRGPGPGLAVLAVDVQDMELLNEIYGRDAGDRALATLGSVILRSVRSTDFSARLGGDDFAIVFPGGDMATVRKAARRITHELEGAIRADLTVPPVVPLFGLAASATAEPSAVLAEAVGGLGSRRARRPVALRGTPVTDGPCVA